MTLVPTVRSRFAFGILALLLVALPAQAEEVTHQFTGQLTTVTNGSGLSADLTGLFTLGQAVTFEYTIERNTPGVPQDPYVSGYTGALTNFAFTIGGWGGSGTPDYSFTTVTDNEPSPGNPSIQYDQYSAQIQGGITAPTLGNTMLQSMTYTLDDIEGGVFASQAIPRTFPELGVFDGKTFTVLFFDFTQLRSGYVMATLNGVATPAHPTTWGGLKGLYR